MDLKKGIESGVVELSKLGGVIGIATNAGLILKNTGDKNEVFNYMKVVAHDSASVFTALGQVVKDKNVSGVLDKSQKLSEMLSKDTLMGDAVKDAYAVITSLVSSIIKVVADIGSMNMASLVQDGASLITASHDALKLLIQGFKKFKEFYDTKLKPFFHDLHIKIHNHHEAKKALKEEMKQKKLADKKIDDKKVVDPSEHHSKMKDIKDALHKIGEKIHHKSKAESVEKVLTDGAVGHSAASHMDELVKAMSFEELTLDNISL